MEVLPSVKFPEIFLLCCQIFTSFGVETIDAHYGDAKQTEGMQSEGQCGFKSIGTGH